MSVLQSLPKLIKFCIHATLYWGLCCRICVYTIILFPDIYQGGYGLFAHSVRYQKQQKQTAEKELPSVALFRRLLYVFSAVRLSALIPAATYRVFHTSTLCVGE